MESSESLSDSLEVYKAQLDQITETLKVTAPGTDRDNLISLKNDIEELLKLTQDSINSLQDSQPNNDQKELPDDDPFSKEYALFKAELESLDTETNPKEQVSSTNIDEVDDQEEEDEEEEDDTSIQNELQSLVGTKCRAPFADKSGSTTYYNALISSVELSETLTGMEHIKVRVLFINPTEKKMVPCPYFLDDKCKFSEENCNFSHGYIVPFDQLKEYIEPDFTRLRPGCRVLAKVPNMNTWISTVIEDVGHNDICVVKHERAFVEIPIHDILPPVEDIKDDSISIHEDNDDNISDNEDIGNHQDGELMLAKNQHHDAMIDLSLSREQPTQKLGQWEQFTKGIGSKLMAKMGYIVGTGLGKSGEGILQPVEPVILPAGKSLDHCMNLKEAAGGSTNLFSLERMQKKLAAKAIARSKREYFRQKKQQEKDVFFVINTSIRTTPSTSTKYAAKNVTKNLSAVTDRQLNVERFKLAESIKQSEKNIKMLKRSIKSLDTHKGGANIQKNYASKLELQQRELVALKSSDNKLEREQIRRCTKKKMTVF